MKPGEKRAVIVSSLGIGLVGIFLGLALNLLYAVSKEVSIGDIVSSRYAQLTAMTYISGTILVLYAPRFSSFAAGLILLAILPFVALNLYVIYLIAVPIPAHFIPIIALGVSAARLTDQRNPSHGV